MATGYDGSIRIDTRVDTKEFNAGIKSMQAGMGKLKVSIQGVAAALGLAFGTFQAVDIASDLTEVENVVTTAFGNMSDQVDRWAKSSIKNFGMSELAAKRTASTYMAMNAGMGLTGQTAADMALRVAERTADIASFYNMTQEEADTMLKSIWTGETESLKRIGVVMTQTNLDAYALANGIQKTTSEMTQAEQVQLRYAYVMDQTRLAAGDFYKTQDSWANQTRILSEQWKQFLGIVGGGIIQVLTPLLQTLNKIVEKLIEWAQVFAQVIGLLMGNISDEQNQAASAAGALTDATNAAVDSQNTLEDAAKKANKALDRQTASIDELNVISKEAESNASNGISNNASATAPIVDIPAGEDGIAIGENLTISPKAEKIAEKIRTFLDGLKTTLGTFSPLLKGIATGFATAFALTALAKGVSKIVGFSKQFGVLNDAIAMGTYLFKRYKSPLKAVTGGFKQLGKSFKNFMRNLSPAQKAAVSVVALTATFVTAKNAAKDYFLGTKDLGSALLNIIPVITAVGVAMTAMLGPAGLILTAITALVGAVVGFNDAQKQLQAEFIDATFFDGVGASLDVFNDYLILGQEESSTLRQRIIELGDTVAENNAKIDTAQQNLETYQTILQNTGTVTSEQAGKMEENFNDLVVTLRDNFEYNTNQVFLAFSGASKKAAEDLGIDVGTMTNILVGFQQTFNDKTTQLEARMQPYWDKLKAGEILTPEDQQEFNDLLAYTNELAESVSDTQVKFKDQTESISKINFESTDEAVAKLDEIKETGSQLLEELDASKQQSEAAIETLKGQATTMFEHGDLTQSAYNQAMEMFSQYSQGIDAGYKRDKEEIENSLASALGAIELKLDEQITNTADQTAATLWDKIKAAWDAVTSGDDIVNWESHLPAVLRETVEKQVGEPIREKLEEVGKSLGVEADQKLGAELLNGLRKGITDNTDTAVDATEDTTEEIIDAAKNTAGVHSPSTVFKSIGKSLMEGLAIGVKNNKSMVIDAFSDVFNSILNKFQSFADSIRTSTNSLLWGTSSALGSFSASPAGPVKFTPMPRVAVPALATGAVIPPNQQFMAVLGDQKHGRNLEAPENLLRQIVREEGGGNNEIIYLLQQLVDMARDRDSSVTLEVDGRKLAEAVERGQKARGVPIFG